jgi:Sulfotransferase family
VVSWKRTLNRALWNTTGFELRRTGGGWHRRMPHPTDRLVKNPAFVLCTVRSGSTLLRVLLDSHSHIHAPQELHLRDVSVTLKSSYAEKALAEVGLDARHLEHLLWDRVLHRELVQSGKRLLVNKTPSDVFIADRILECWPDARFIFLLRHPVAIARSRQKARPQDSPAKNVGFVRSYADALEEARGKYPGITVRYEELVADPAVVMRRVCAFLGVAWEPEMLEYGRVGHGRYRSGLGDWGEKIRSGRVQAAGELPKPEEVPVELHDLAVAWGYLDGAPDPPPARSVEVARPT